MLPLCLVPQSGEVLSGYLIRLAHVCGQVPTAFFPFRLRQPHFWCYDVDRGMSTDGMAALQALCSLPALELEAMTLASTVQALTPTHYSPSPHGVIPWLNALHTRTLAMRLPAFQFCPLCLAEGSSLRKEWRLSFVTCCDRHGRPLQNCCAKCGSPFVPFRSVRHIFSCPRCGADLRAQHPIHWRDAWCQELPRMQRLLLTSLDMVMDDSQAESVRQRHRDQLVSVRVLASLYPRWARYCPHLKPRSLADATARLALELESLQYRCRALSWSDRLLEDWPSSFRLVAEQSHLTRRSFLRAPRLCTWLQKEVDNLPSGRRRNRFGRIDALAQSLNGLAASRPENWRAMRARKLMEAARKDASYGTH